MDQGPIGQVGLMILTALPTDDHKGTLMFYAAIDTGAAQSQNGWLSCYMTNGCRKDTKSIPCLTIA